jgi:hypothetical protein
MLDYKYVMRPCKTRLGLLLSRKRTVFQKRPNSIIHSHSHINISISLNIMRQIFKLFKKMFINYLISAVFSMRSALRYKIMLLKHNLLSFENLIDISFIIWLPVMKILITSCRYEGKILAYILISINQMSLICCFVMFSFMDRSILYSFINGF